MDDEKEIYFDDEREDVLFYIKENPDIYNLGIALMFATGIRIGELVTLKWEDFDDLTFKVRRTETRYKDSVTGEYHHEVKEYPKTPAGIRTVIIPEKYRWVIRKLRQINPFRDYIFSYANGKRMQTQAIRKRVYSLCDKLGINRKSPHKIRKTYGTILLDNHIDEKISKINSVP